jgi:hypothetical protein
MNSWFSKLKMSRAFSDEHNASADHLQLVDRALRSQPPAFETPPDLHFAIMNEVRQAARANSISPPKHTSKSLLRWLPAPAFVALTLVAGWWLFNHRVTSAVRQPEKTQIALAEVGPALELGGSATRELPPVVVGPLSDELDRMNTDLKNAAGFLLSSLP